AEPVDETGVGGRVKVGEHGPQRREIRAVEAEAVYLGHRDDPDADAGGAARHCMEEPLAILVSDLLRVVQPGERTDTSTTEPPVVEEPPCHDERSGERSAASLVGARDEAHTEAAIVCEEPLAARASHRPRIDASPAGARGRAPSSPLFCASSRASRVGRRRLRRPRASRSSESGAGTYARRPRRTTACGP